MHFEALIVDTHSFCRWPEYITQQISVMNRPTIFSTEVVLTIKVTSARQNRVLNIRIIGMYSKEISLKSNVFSALKVIIIRPSDAACRATWSGPMPASATDLF
jgi:hypothetical protein